MADKIIALFVEGPTEIELYKAIIKKMHDKMPTPLSCSFDYSDLKGIGNYKSTALRKYRNLAQKNPGKEINLFLCIDSDVFALEKKPPINRKKVQQELLDAGAHSVTYIMAKYSIEDWFLSDLEGICKFLHIPATTKRPSGNGQDALKALFHKVSKVYTKGTNVAGLVEKLDIDLIIQTHCRELKPLCKVIGIDCSIVCNKT